MSKILKELSSVRLSLLPFLHPSPAFSLPFHARKGRLCGCLYDPNNPPIVLTGSIIDLGVEFHNEVINIDFLNEVEKIKVNTLLIQGMNDPVVHFSYAKGIKNKDIKKVFIDKMTHGLDEIFIQDIMNEIRCFLLQ